MENLDNSVRPWTVQRAFKLLACAANYGQPGFLLIVRLYIGYQCAHAGYNHLTHFDKTAAQFKEWNIPMPAMSAAMAGGTELVGGTLLFLGLAARLISIPLVFNFFVAMLTIEGTKLIHFWSHMDDVIGDTAFPFFMTALLILFFGPGFFSIDRAIGWEKAKKRATPAGFPAGEIPPGRNPSHS